MRKRICILGSTGSIGSQALTVIGDYPGMFSLYAISGGENLELLIHQARQFRPQKVVIANPDKYNALKEALQGLPIEVSAGLDSLGELAGTDEYDLLLSSLVGYAGLYPTLRAIGAGREIALANKETLVVAGDLVKRIAMQHQVQIIPVDSEHSAIFQCLQGEEPGTLEKVILTASGGPFRDRDRAFLEKVKPGDALRHPNWCMGDKITIDSASLMNKGLEAIEAKWLFGLEPSQIEVLIHPQSVIHSMVQFVDGSMKAQLGVPDMRLPILYALSYPHRLSSSLSRIRFEDYPNLSFSKPDIKNFRNLAIAFECMEKGGNLPCVMNAANEIAVGAFLKERISFLQMPEIIDYTLEKASYIKSPGYDDYVATDAWARKVAHERIDQLMSK